MQSICPNCLIVLQDIKTIKTKINSPFGYYFYQCSNCYYLSNGIKVYNIDEECPICLEKDVDSIHLYGCNHWICKSCYDQDENKSICKMCQEDQDNGPNQFYHRNTYLPKMIPNDLQESFMKLYKRVYQYVYTSNINYSQHTKTIVLLEEYYLWLLLLSNDERGANYLSPSTAIDNVWHMHILDIKDYIEVCQKIAGRILDHYPENSFSNLKSLRRVRLVNTLVEYKKKFQSAYNMSDLHKTIWQEVRCDLIEHYTCIPDHKMMNVEFSGFTNYGKTVIPFTDETPIEDIWTMINESSDFPLVHNAYLVYNKQTLKIDDDKICKDYEFEDGCTVYCGISLRGC